MKKINLVVITIIFFLFGCKKESFETKASNAADRYVGTYVAEVLGGGRGDITIIKSGMEIIVSFKEDPLGFNSYNLDFMLVGTYIDEGPSGYFEFEASTDCLSDTRRYDISGGSIKKEDWSDSKVEINLNISYPVTSAIEYVPEKFIIREI